MFCYFGVWQYAEDKIRHIITIVILPEKFSFVKSYCVKIVVNLPNDKNTEREEIKNMLKDLYKKYPKAHDNFKLMLTNLDKLVLWDKENNE